ncbi:aldo/keto reductase [Loigolactobacillus binensis]|uniref:Aldo/keto reductase family oxidoreductase n=1 Tax=Loigolactobacillus binensis TaxID=2559922 RepID=A0ABW3EDL5_9LACO|nr:aldo/keto reductase [Loigolactobacillus binensis]
MKFVDLGHSGLKASNVALGVMRIDGLADDTAAQKVLETAVANGINFFDNADMYGKGACETRFGRALRQSNIKREDILIQTKVGILDHAYDFSKAHLVAAVDGSLQRLGVDYVDSLLLHRPDALIEPEAIAEVFNDLQNAGKVRQFGVSNMNPGQVELLQHSVQQKLIVNQLQFGIMHTGPIDAGIHVNMTDSRSVDHDGGIIEYSRLHDMTIQAWSPFQYGFFEGVFIDNPKFAELNAELQKLADKYQVTKNAIAVAWILRHPAHMQVILGSMNQTRIAQMAVGSDVELTHQEWYDVYLAAGNDLP